MLNVPETAKLARPNKALYYEIMMSDATSDGAVNWQSEVDEAIARLSKNAKADWWRVAQFLYRNYIQNNRKDFHLLFDLQVSKKELAPDDDIILQEISNQAGAMLIIDSGSLFDRKFGPDIQDDIGVAHKPGACVHANPRLEYLHHKLRDQIRNNPSQKEVEMKALNRSGLTLDLGKATLTYRRNPPKPINPGNAAIRMLACLMKSKFVVNYTELGRVTDVSAYNEHRANESESLRTALHVVKAALISILKDADVPQKIADKMIKVKPKTGYIFTDQTP